MAALRWIACGLFRGTKVDAPSRQNVGIARGDGFLRLSEAFTWWRRGAILLAFATLGATIPGPDAHQRAFGSVRFDDPFARFVSPDIALDALARDRRDQTPLALELRHDARGYAWEISLARSSQLYKRAGKFISWLIVDRFDAFTSRPVSTSIVKTSAPHVQPNATMPSANGPATPCPHGPPIVSPPRGYYVTTPPPHAISGQNYGCLRPIGGQYPVHRPEANATQPLRSFRSLKALFDDSQRAATRFGGYVVAVKLEPFGVAAKEEFGGITTYNTEAMRMVAVVHVVAPNGLPARECRAAFSRAVWLVDAQTGAPAGGSSKNFCRPGTEVRRRP